MVANCELSRVLRRLLGSNFADHVTRYRPTFLGETGTIPWRRPALRGCRGAQAGSRRVRAAWRGCLDAVEHPAILAAGGPGGHAAITCASAMAA